MAYKPVLKPEPVLYDDKVTRSDMMSNDEVRLILNSMYNTYDLDTEAAIVEFREGLYEYVFLNGTSDKSVMSGVIKVSGSNCNLAHIDQFVSGSQRRFFRSLQKDAHRYLMAPESAPLRIRIKEKFGIISKAEDADALIDFFRDVLTHEKKVIAAEIKAERIRRSNANRNRTARYDIREAFAGAPAPSDHDGDNTGQNY